MRPGDVITLRSGLHVFHNQDRSVTVLKRATPARIESIREYQYCTMISARALSSSGTYYAEGALLTFAQRGDFLPSFIQTEIPVLRNMDVGRRSREQG